MSGRKRAPSSKTGAGAADGGVLAAATTATASKKPKRQLVKLADDSDVVLQKCRELKEKLRLKKMNAAASGGDDNNSSDYHNEDSGSSSSDDNNNNNNKKTPSTKNTPMKASKSTIPSDIVEVDELSATEVLEGIENIALRITESVLAKKGFSMDIPSRAASNQIYVKEWDRIVLGQKGPNVHL